MPDTPLNPEHKDDCVETATRFGIESTQWSETTSDPSQRDSLIDYKGSKVGKSRWESVPVNPDALEVARNMFVFMCADGFTPKDEDLVKGIVSAYLAVAQPEITSIEELKELPLGSLIQDSSGETVLRFDGPNYDWITGGDGRYNMAVQGLYLPARVIFRPKV